MIILYTVTQFIQPMYNVNDVMLYLVAKIWCFDPVGPPPPIFKSPAMKASQTRFKNTSDFRAFKNQKHEKWQF